MIQVFASYFNLNVARVQEHIGFTKGGYIQNQFSSVGYILVFTTWYRWTSLSRTRLSRTPRLLELKPIPLAFVFQSFTIGYLELPAISNCHSFNCTSACSIRVCTNSLLTRQSLVLYCHKTGKDWVSSYDNFFISVHSWLVSLSNVMSGPRSEGNKNNWIHSMVRSY